MNDLVVGRRPCLFGLPPGSDKKAALQSRRSQKDRCKQDAEFSSEDSGGQPFLIPWNKLTQVSWCFSVLWVTRRNTAFFPSPTSKKMLLPSLPPGASAKYHCVSPGLLFSQLPSLTGQASILTICGNYKNSKIRKATHKQHWNHLPWNYVAYLIFCLQTWKCILPCNYISNCHITNEC